MSWLAMVGWGAGGVLILSWLIISFTAPGARRTIVEWIGATAMYLLLCSLFVHMVGRALASGNHVAVGAFGFLCALFGAGLVLSAVHAVKALSGGSREQVSATN